MNKSVTLRGATWSRAEPLVACSDLWHEKTGVRIEWDNDTPPHDLIVVDHTQIGQMVREDRLLTLNRADRVADLVRLAHQSVGESFNSYRMLGDQWALPVEAGAQVQAWRTDRPTTPPRTWDEVVTLARAGRVLLPMRPPHALLVFYTLTANLGQPCASTGESELNDPTFGASVLERMRMIMSHIDPVCYDLDPTGVLERLSAADATEHCAPLIMGDVRYARDGFRATRLGFGNIPPVGGQGPAGATLGGSGIAVSADCQDPDAAVAFAFWLASAEVQRGPYAAAGGQPGNAAAWHNAAQNAATHNFYRDTWPTLDGAWVRPRHDGYPAFEHAAAARIVEGLRDGQGAASIMADLNQMFSASFG